MRYILDQLDPSSGPEGAGIKPVIQSHCHALWISIYVQRRRFPLDRKKACEYSMILRL